MAGRGGEVKRYASSHFIQRHVHTILGQLGASPLTSSPSHMSAAVAKAAADMTAGSLVT